MPYEPKSRIVLRVCEELRETRDGNRVERMIILRSWRQTLGETKNTKCKQAKEQYIMERKAKQRSILVRMVPWLPFFLSLSHNKHE